MRRLRPLLIALALLFGTSPVRAGFASLEQYLAAVGRVTGAGGAEFYTTIWVTNLTPAPVSFTFEFLKQGQANTSPASFTDSLAPGQTKVYENVVQTKLGLSDALGGARVTSTGEILVAERIYNQPPGADLGETEGLFFAGVPKAFSISLGQSASIQGVDQGGAEDFRYNFALLETGGGSPTVNVQLFDGDGTMLGQKAYPLQPYEQLQPNVKDLFAGVATTNARITATVTGGTGSAMIAGAQLANTSQDSSGFEMSFRGQLLGGGGAAGVTSLNGLAGGLTIAHGANTTVNVSGNTITIDAVSGSGKGLSAVAHDNSLAGSGTVAVPLGIAPGGVGNAQLGAGAVTAPKIAAGQVVTGVNGIHDGVTLTQGNNVTLTTVGNSIRIDAAGGGGSGVSSLNGETGAVTLAAGSNVSLTPAGNTITIAASGGGGGGLTLPFNGTVGSAIGFAVSNSGTGEAIDGSSSSSAEGVHGASQSGYGVRGTSVSNIGVYGQSAAGGGNTSVGVYGTNSNANGAGVGGANTINGNLGFLGGPSYGVAGVNAHGAQAAVYGTSSSSSGYGVQGNNSSSGSNGYLGGVDYGVFGSSSGNNGVVGKTSANNTGAIWGHNNTSGNDGFLGGPDYGIYGVSAAKTGVYGSSSALDAVAGHCQTNSCFAIHGVSAGGGYAGVFEGTVSINGDLNVNGDVSKSSGSFKIDDPIDPANKYLYHSFVESPDMKDVYDGEATLDASGIAVVELPAWFQALNRDFRYQLTALDTAQPALHIAKRIESNRFTIAGGVPGGEVSWQVTGIRQDAFANAHRIPTEIAKPANEQGRYLHPELFGQPAEKSIGPIADRGIAPDDRR